MRIKPATTSSDFELICELAAQIWEPTYGTILSKAQLDYMFEHIYTVERLAQQANEGQFFYLYFNENGIAKGFAAWSWTEKNVVKLNKIYVLPSEHGTGVGRYLLNFVEQTVRAAGAERIWLCVNRANRAKQFYEKMAYAVLREEDFEFGPYFMNDFVLEKTLK